MNILVMGAGAIGSFFGGVLSKKNKVFLIGRKPHVEEISKNGLKIKGKTNLNANPLAFDSIDKVSEDFDLILLTVKSYDTEKAVKQIKKMVTKDTLILSLQNGLDNVKKITKYIDKKNVLAGVTSNGVIFEKPGLIFHTGIGYTTIGEINNKKTDRAKKITKIFNESGIKTSLNSNILEEIWIKAIVNSSINPLTTFFNCKNGYLLENPVLKNLVKKICKESTNIARSNNFNLDFNEMYEKTKSVIIGTKNNYSSMLQSFLNNKPLEIDSINGVLVEIGKKNKVNTILNEILVFSVKSII